MRDHETLDLFRQHEDDSPRVIAGTGHRPEKIQIGDANAYDPRVAVHLREFACEHLMSLQADEVISGMALGWDTALAEAARKMGIPYHAYIPFRGQEARWAATSRSRYRELLQDAASVVVVNAGRYAAWKMHARNAAMVDDASRILALYSGGRGGTAACVALARKRRVPVANAWQAWLERGRKLENTLKSDLRMPRR